MGSISPIKQRMINLFKIISSAHDEQDLTLSYEIASFNHGISAGEINFTYNPLPDKVTISSPYPNPFNPVTSFKYGMPEKSDVLIQIYNIQGRLIDEVALDGMEVGYHTFNWDGTYQSSGMYLIKIKIHDTVKTHRAMLIK